LLRKHLEEAQAEEVAHILSQGTWTHDYPIGVEEARSLGLKVSTEMPLEVYALMEMYPQPRGGKPSVQYVPLPYEREPRPSGPRRQG
jgi:ClpP class serine protease